MKKPFKYFLSFNFKDKLSRNDYFITTLLLTTGFIILNLILMFMMSMMLSEQFNFGILVSIFSLFTFVYFIYCMILLFCLTVQRLNDAGKNQNYALLLLIPYIGILILLYFLVQPSK